MNKKIFAALFSVLIILLFIFSGCKSNNLNGDQPNNSSESAEQSAETPLLGGDSDEHGCIGSAGYSWCKAKQKCLRIWEEDC